MTRLTQVQNDFQRFLTAGDATIETHVIGTTRVPVAVRLGIYGDAYRSRLIEALQNNFPVLAEVLGEDDFETLAAQYVRAHTSTFFSIRYYGDQLAQFLESDPEYAQIPVLAELSRWEWAMAAVFDAADADQIDADAFARFPPESWSELRFVWSPSVQVLELSWNVADIWKAVTEEQEHPAPSHYPERRSWLCWRRDLQIYYRALEPAEAEIIGASRAGRSFGDLCHLLCAHVAEDEAPARAAGFLRGWVQSGLLASAELPP